MSNEQMPMFEKRTSDIHAASIAVKLDLLHDDVTDMKSVLKELTAAISRLAVVESDQGHIRAAQERTFLVLEKVETRLEKLETRVLALEQLGVDSKRSNAWVDKAVWAVVAAVAMYVAKKVGLVT